MDTILEGKVAAAIKNLKVQKTPGEDNITAEMIQTGAECTNYVRKSMKKNNAQWTGVKRLLSLSTRRTINRNAATTTESVYLGFQARCTRGSCNRD